MSVHRSPERKGMEKLVYEISIHLSACIILGWDPSDRNLNAAQKRNAVTRRSAMHYQSEGTGERTLVGLEAGAGHAIAFASGSATTATALQSLGPNAHILSVNDVYGGTSPGLQRKPQVPRCHL